MAKLVHEMEGRTAVSLVDFNRAGVPLVEIVTEPDFRTPYQAMEFLKALRTLVRYVGASECSMENGTMRADANISIRPPGTDQLNTKVEVKNMNSVRHVGDAIAYEIERQSTAVEAGDAVILHTRLWDPDKKVTQPMRAKFEGPCIPDPSVPAIELSPVWIEDLRSRLPELPGGPCGPFGRPTWSYARGGHVTQRGPGSGAVLRGTGRPGCDGSHSPPLADDTVAAGAQGAAAGVERFARGPLAPAGAPLLAVRRPDQCQDSA